MTGRRVWVVECRIEDDDPAQFGPYTEKQANLIVERIKREVDFSTDRWGTSHHPSSISNATCFPMGRYEELIGWMTTEEKRAVRDEVREAGERYSES